MAQLEYEGLSEEPGIYFIFNLLTKRIYIGSCKCFRDRWAKHLYSLRAQKHVNKFLQADFTKCTEAAFEFHVLEHLPTQTVEERLAVEQIWIDQYFDDGKQCYNLENKATSNRTGTVSKRIVTSEMKKQRAVLCQRKFRSKKREEKLSLRVVQPQTEESECTSEVIRLGKPGPNTGKIASEETRQKQRAAKLGKKQSPETIAKRAAANTGKKRTQETCDKISQALMGKSVGVGHSVSPETRLKISQKLKGHTVSEETRAKMRGPRNNADLHNM